MLNELAQAGHIFIFEKDRHGRYLGCNESFAKAAGLDAPVSIIGKSDADLIWKVQADFFRTGDRQVLSGQQMMNTPEIQIQSTGVAQIVTTKLAKADGSGVVGSFIDLTGYMLIKRNGRYDEEEKRFYLGAELGHEYLDNREFQVFKEILLGLTAGQIAEKLTLSTSSVNWYTDRIKLKLQCQHKTQLLTCALRYGLTHILY